MRSVFFVVKLFKLTNQEIKMGCDIHIYCEEYMTVNGVKKWFNKDLWQLNPYYGEYDGEDKYVVVELCGDRNYSMFSALCGVRDHTGKTPKISEPRGIPVDTCPEIIEAAEFWSGDGHSHSYCTLREVKEFVKKGAPVKFSGLISRQAAEDLDENGLLPTWWCQGSSDGTLVFREWVDSSYSPLSELYELMAERFDNWRKPDDIPDERLDNFRIVFWFDN